MERLADDEIDRRLTKDAEYITSLALSAGTFLFTEMCGLIFLRAFGKDLYNFAAKKILEKTDLVSVYKDVDFEPIKEKISTKTFGEKDLFTSFWLLFVHIVQTELAESDQWRNAFFTESSKPRIMYRESTRRRILERVIELDLRAEKRPLNYDFSDFFDGVGIIKRVRKLVTE